MGVPVAALVHGLDAALAGKEGTSARSQCDAGNPNCCSDVSSSLGKGQPMASAEVVADSDVAEAVAAAVQVHVGGVSAVVAAVVVPVWQHYVQELSVASGQGGVHW